MKTRKREKVLVILKFQDPNDRETNEEYVVLTDRTEDELQEVADKIRDGFENDGFEDWSYSDVVEEMIKQGYIESPDFKVKWYEVLL